MLFSVFPIKPPAIWFLTDSLIIVVCQGTQLIKTKKQAYCVWSPGKCK